MTNQKRTDDDEPAITEAVLAAVDAILARMIDHAEGEFENGADPVAVGLAALSVAQTAFGMVMSKADVARILRSAADELEAIELPSAGPSQH